MSVPDSGSGWKSAALEEAGPLRTEMGSVLQGAVIIYLLLNIVRSFGLLFQKWNSRSGVLAGRQSGPTI